MSIRPPAPHSILLIGGNPAHLDWLHTVARQYERELFDIRYAVDTDAARCSGIADEPATSLVIHHADVGPSSSSLRERLLFRRPDVTLARLGDGPSEPPYGATVELTTRADAAVSAQWIERALRLRDALSDPHVQKLAGAIEDLPSMPEDYRRLRRAADKNGAPISEVARIIEGDPSLAVRVLQLANSAAFGRVRRVTRLSDACSILGTRHIRDLAMALHLLESYAGLRGQGFSLEDFQATSVEVARMASAFLRDVDREHADAAFTCGLIRDIGKLMIAQEQPRAFAEVNGRVAARPQPYAEAEFAVTGATHSEVGALLLQAWGLPFELVEAAAFHHYPSMAASRTNQVLAAVHAADVLQGVIVRNEPEGQLDTAFIEDAGLGHCLEDWRRMAETFAAQPRSPKAAKPRVSIQ